MAMFGAKGDLYNDFFPWAWANKTDPNKNNTIKQGSGYFLLVFIVKNLYYNITQFKTRRFDYSMNGDKF